MCHLINHDVEKEQKAVSAVLAIRRQGGSAYFAAVFHLKKHQKKYKIILQI